MLNAKEIYYATQLDNNWAAFQQRILDLPSQEQIDVKFAFLVARAAHRGQYRKSGEPYIFHPLAVASILLDAGVRNYRMLVGGLFHDVPEETTYLEDAFGPSSATGSRDWDRIEGSFDRETAAMVNDLTPPHKWVFGDRADEEYYNAMRHSSPEAILIKMADRLHNLRTLDAMPPEKQTAKVKETTDIYYPIFRRALETYPQEGGLLFGWIKDAVSERT